MKKSQTKPEISGEVKDLHPVIGFFGKVLRVGLSLAGELTAIVLGVAFVWFYGLNVLLAQKTVDVSFLKPNASLWFSQAFDGKSASVDHLELSWRPEIQAIVLDARDIAVADDKKLPLQNLEQLEIAVDFEHALRGKMTPRHIQVSGGAVTWIKDENGVVTAGLGTPDSVGKFGALPEQSTALAANDGKRSFAMGSLLRVSATNAQVYIIDKTRGIDFYFPETDVRLEKKVNVSKAGSNSNNSNNSSESFHMSLRSVLTEGDDTGDIAAQAAFSGDFEDFDLDITLAGINPRYVAPDKGFAAISRKFDVPVDLSLQISANRDAGLEVVALDLTSGAGTGNIGQRTNRINSIAVSANYDPGSGALNIGKFNLDGSRFGGFGRASLTNIGRPATGFFKNNVGFKGDFSDVKLDMIHIFDDLFEFPSLKFEGSYNPGQRSLALDHLGVQIENFTLATSLSLTRNPAGGLEALSGSGSIEGDMTPGNLLSIWPSKFALGGRRWIDRSVKGGLISDLKLEFDIPPSVFAGGGLRNEDLTLSFNVRDGTVKYISTMTPYTGAAGRGVLRGNSLEFSAVSGNIGDLDITRGQVSIPRLFPKGGDLIIDVEGRGDVQQMLALIDQKPFEFTSKYGLKPDDFSGQGNVHLDVRRPLLEFYERSRIQYAVEGEFTGVTIPFSMGPHKLEKGDFFLKADSAGMAVKGPANLGPWRTELEWNESFGRDGVPTRYRLVGKMDVNTLDGFGFGFREYFGGFADVVIDAQGQGLSISNADITVDLADAHIRAGDYWSKSTGVAGAIKGKLSRAEDGAVSVKNVDMQAPGLSIQGQAAFAGDARLLSFELENAAIEGFANGRVNVRPNAENTAFNIDMSGAYLDISSIVDRTIKASSGQMGLPMNLTASIDRLALDDMFVLKAADLEIRHNGIGTQAAKITGDMPDGRFMALLSPKASGDGRNLLIEIPDASLATQAFLNMKSIKGGRLKLMSSLPKVGTEGPLNGEIVVEDFALINAPVMAQILSLASLKGLTDAMGGAGLNFARFEAPFSYDSGVLNVRDARAAGSALGLTGNGEIDFAGKTVDMDGVLVPAYTANSALSAIPVIGDIFVGKKGEGIFALNYSVRGPFSKTQVGVNPLSALTPGFLRRIFETEREDLPQDEQPVEVPEGETPESPDAPQ